MPLVSYRLTTRLQLLVALLVAGSIMALVYVIDRYQQRTLLAERVAELENSILLNGKRFQQVVDTLRQDTQFLAGTPPISGIQRTRPNGSGNDRDSNYRDFWINRLEEIFIVFAEAHPTYDRVRYIGLADGGRELAGVERQEGRVTVVPHGRPAREEDRECLGETLRLKAGEIYLSPIRFGGEPQDAPGVPAPILRAAMPIFTPEGSAFGALMVDMNLHDILEAIGHGSLPLGARAFVADRQGRYLLSPAPGGQPAAEGRGLAADFPALTPILDPESSPRWPLRPVAAGGQKLNMALERIHYDPRVFGNFLVLAYALPADILQPHGWPSPANLLLGVTTALLIGALILAALRRMLSPLRRITAAAEAIARGAPAGALPEGGGEIGALGRAFRHMLDRVAERERDYQRLNAELEERVQERTAQLRLAASVVENTSEGVMVVSADGTIVSVNPAFTEITGYSAGEVIGRTPRVLRSDFHDEAFYQAMMGSLSTTGRWQGEIMNRRKNGEIYPEWLTINLIPEANGIEPCYVALFMDVTEQRQKEARVRHLAFHDALTGLPNRSLLEDRLQHALQKARREHHRLAVMFMDLDGFKAVNDSLGHETGDHLLREVARLLLHGLRSTDTVARLGGDEFVILLEDVDTPDHAATVAAELVAAVSRPLEIAGHPIRIGASVGIALFPEHSAAAAELMKHADTAMYAAKAQGKGRYRFFDPALD